MSKHTLILYRNDKTRQFSITARRSDNAHLAGMEKAEAARGFVAVTIANGLEEADAVNAKIIQTDMLTRCGYSRVQRTNLA